MKKRKHVKLEPLVREGSVESVRLGGDWLLSVGDEVVILAAKVGGRKGRGVVKEIVLDVNGGVRWVQVWGGVSGHAMHHFLRTERLGRAKMKMKRGVR